MTVLGSTNRIVYTGNASTTDFTMSNILVLDNTHVVAKLDGVLQTLGTDYTVSALDTASGAVVSFTTAPATDVQVLLQRIVPVTQETDYVENDAFPAETHENALDLQTMALQQFEERLDRSITLPDTTLLTGIEVPDLLNQASKLLQVKPAEDGFQFVDPTFTSDGVINVQGDLIKGGSGGVAERLAVGAAGALLRVLSGEPEWLAIGSEGQILRSISGNLAYEHPAIRGHIAGLTLSNAADADHDITVAVGEAADSTGAKILKLTAALTKQIDAAWAAGDAAGGLFSGTVAADTWYHVFLIEKDSDGSIDAGFDTSVTAANIPTGYTLERRIGSVLTDGSANIIAFVQSGDKFQWKVPKTDRNGTAPGTGALLTALSVPLGIKVTANITVNEFDDSIAADWYVLVTDPDQTDSVPTASLKTFDVIATTAGSNHGGNVHGGFVTNTASQIRTRQTDSQADITIVVVTHGWIDDRGRFA